MIVTENIRQNPANTIELNSLHLFLQVNSLLVFFILILLR